MEKQALDKRFLYPVAIAFLIMAISWLIYNAAWRIDHSALHRILASVSGTLLFVSVAFASPFLYPALFFRGASLPERIAGCLANPFLWATKENLRLMISYSPAEAFYYYFNPLNLWLLLGIIAQMGAIEMFCRWRLRAAGESAKVITIGPLAAVAIGLFLAISLFLWGQGEGTYVIFLSGYREFFGAGI